MSKSRRSVGRAVRQVNSRKFNRINLLEGLENRQLFATLQVGSGQTYSTIQAAIDAAANNDTIMVAPGNYVSTPVGRAGFGSLLYVDKPLTIRSTGGSGTTTITSGATEAAAIRIEASDVTIDGFTVLGGKSGIVAGFDAVPDVRVTLRNLLVTPSPTSTLGHGVNLSASSNSLISNVQVTSAHDNGIFVDNGSNNVIVENSTVGNTVAQHSIAVKDSSNVIVRNSTVMDSDGHGIIILNSPNARVTGSTVQIANENGIFFDNSPNGVVDNSTVNGTRNQHAIAAKNSDHMSVVLNTITGSGFSGVLFVGSSEGVIDSNNITGYRFDGITLSDDNGGTGKSSSHNVVSNNITASSVYIGDGNNTTTGQQDGTGIFVDSNSNGNYVFGNKVSGHAENGIAVFNASFNVVEANEVFMNRQGGIFVLFDQTGFSRGSVPVGNVLYANRIFNNTFNSSVILRGAIDTSVIANHFQARLNSATPGGGMQIENSQGSKLIRNTASGTTIGLQVFSTSTNTTILQNRFVDAPQLFITPNATVTLSDGSAVGGNYYSDMAVTGNPSTGTPYTKFITDTAGNSGTYRDLNPFASTEFGQTEVLSFPAAQTAASFVPGTTTTLIWNTNHVATLVDLSYVNAQGQTVVIAENYPNTGAYRWTVPGTNVAAGAVKLSITPKNPTGTALGAAVVSGDITVSSAAGNVVNVSTPAAFEDFVAGDSIKVIWQASAGGATYAVDLFDGSAYREVATGVTDTTASFTVPGGIDTSDALIRVRVTAGPGAGNSATMDVPFTIRATNGTAIITAPATAPVGTLVEVGIRVPSTSALARVEYINGSTTTQIYQGPTAVSVPVFSRNTTTASSTLRLSAFDSSNALLATADAAVNVTGGTTDSPVSPPPPPTGGGTGIDLTGTLTGKLTGGVVAGKKGTAKLVVKNSGTVAATGSLTTELFLVPDGQTVATTASFASGKAKTVNLKPGKTTTISIPFAYPTSLADGNYTLTARFGSTGITEDNTTNNVVSVASAIAIQQARVDLAVTSVTGPATLVAGKAKYSFVLKNNGNVTASAKGAVLELFASGDQLLDATIDQLLATNNLNISLKAGQSKTIKVNATLANLPTAASFVGVRVNATTTPADSDVSNNVGFSATAVALG